MVTPTPARIARAIAVAYLWVLAACAGHAIVGDPSEARLWANVVLLCLIVGLVLWDSRTKGDE